MTKKIDQNNFNAYVAARLDAIQQIRNTQPHSTKRQERIRLQYAMIGVAFVEFMNMGYEDVDRTK